MSLITKLGYNIASSDSIILKANDAFTHHLISQNDANHSLVLELTETDLVEYKKGKLINLENSILINDEVKPYAARSSVIYDSV